MANLIVEQKTVLELLGNKKAFYLIPDYQRPYAWGEQECSTLWNDIYEFSIPDNNAYAFDGDEEYFLGPIVTFENNKKKEVIDGQQRLTTLLLLLRAFYCGFGSMQDENSLETKKKIEECIWKTNEFNKPDMNILKIDSEVASDEHKEEFLSILKTGIVNDSMKSNYANNYRFFQKKIEDFLHTAPTFFPFLPNRIMKNCILLPIEAESQDTALRIFSTLNDRGKPLSDADIFKAQLYKHYTSTGKKDAFIKRWKEFEALCSDIYHPISGTAMDEAFTRYMYYERAKLGIKSSTTEALRKFYERDNYALLKKDQTFDNIVELTEFWADVAKQDDERFSDRVLRRLYVLNYAPNGMWEYFVSVFYMANRDENGLLDDDKFYTFLNRIIGFIWAYAVVYPGVNALRTPVYAEMIKVINGDEVDFADYRFDAENTRNKFDNYSFSNNRAITKSMLVWWAFNDDNQKLLDINTTYEIEHIFARQRAANDGMRNNKNLESLGNKVILEKRINIRASDYRFDDKKKYYTGFTNSKGQRKDGSKVYEIVELANKPSYDFDENEIVKRYDTIINSFMDFLKQNGLIQ